VRTVADIALPLDAHRLNQREYRTVQRAAWRLTRDCVRRFGGDYTVPESAVVANLPRFDNDNERRYGLFDADLAAVRGYNVPPDQLPPPVDRSRGWNPSETEKLLVRGGVTPGGGPPGTARSDTARPDSARPDSARPGSARPGTAQDPDVPTDVAGKPLPDGGCQGEADRAIAAGAPRPPDEHLANRLSIDTFRRSEGDSRVREAMARWSACMTRAGYSYRDIWEPNDYLWPDPVGAEEIGTATADVACKRETGLVAVWLRVETAYQRRVIEQRAQELTTTQVFARTTARNAAQIVGGG
jgi:hypothetical protein